jgi:hypothetical protein
MKDSFKSELKQMLNQSASLDLIQQKCRKILRSMFENFDFSDTKLKPVILEFCNHEGFPIKYGIRNENVTSNVPKTNPVAVYVILGLIGISVSIFSNRMDNSFLNILGVLVALSFGIGAGYYYAKSKTPAPSQSYLVVISTVDEIIGMIDSAYQNIIKLIPTDKAVAPEVDPEILQWLQRLYAKSCRDVEKKDMKEDIEDLISRLGYEFFYYTSDDTDYFDASNANITEVSTSVPAMRNAITNNVVLRGRVVFPM